MQHDAYAFRPLILGHNRVRRAYSGGYMLDEWQGLENPKDNNWPEELLVSTTEVTTEGHPPGEGLSMVELEDGSRVSLRDLIHSAPEAFLGSAYTKSGFDDIGVAARIGDSATRLIIQTHPDDFCARKYLNFPRGKAEGWYIAGCREVDGARPCLYAGFREWVTRAKWEELFYKQDINGMLDAMHRFTVKKGDSFFVPAGMPHALGSGLMFVEIHQPCDYTLRMERTYNDNTIHEQDLHYGMGIDRMFDCYHYDSYTPEQIEKICRTYPVRRFEGNGITVDNLMDFEKTVHFSADLVSFEKRGTKYSFSKQAPHCIAIVLQGDFDCGWNGGGSLWRQGHGVFIPAGVSEMDLKAQSDGCRLIFAYPRQPPK